MKVERHQSIFEPEGFHFPGTEPVSLSRELVELAFPSGASIEEIEVSSGELFYMNKLMTKSSDLTLVCSSFFRVD